MRGHVDSETLAAFREELLARRRARRVAAHLGGCPRCAGLDARLAELPALLARSPVPPMPAALTARIQAAIAAEAAARSAQTADAGAGGAGGVAVHRGAGRPAPRWSAGRSRLALRVAAVTAAVVVVAGGGYEVSRLVAGGQPAATAGAGRAPALPGHRSAAQNGQGGAAARGTMSPTSGLAPGPNGTATVPLIVTSTDFRPGRLAAQVRAALTRRVTAPASGREKNGASPGPAVTGFADLPGCVRHVAAGQRPLLVDVARYNGEPAAVIVLPATPSAPERAVVVGTSCSATVTGRLASTTLPSR